MTSLPYHSPSRDTAVIDWSGVPQERFSEIASVHEMVNWVRTHPQCGSLSVALPSGFTPPAYRLRRSLIALGCTVRISHSS